MEALGIDGKLLVAQIINFVIFFLIFKKFVAKPLMSGIKKQQDEEQKRHQLTQELEEARNSLEEQKKAMMAEVKKEQKDILDQAKQYAEGVKKDMLEQSQKQATEIIEAGKEALAQERKKAQAEVTQYVKEAAQVAIEKGFRTYLNDQTRKQITETVINNL